MNLASLMERHFEADALVGDRAVAYLKRFGYLPRSAAESAGRAAALMSDARPILDAVEDAVTRLQRFHGLIMTGKLDAPTLAVLDAPRCGCEDDAGVARLETLAARWQRRDLTYRVRSYIPGIPQSVQDGVYETIYRDWRAVLDLSITRVRADRPGDITIVAEPIDGPGNVLAQAQLANGRDGPLWLQFNAREARWAALPGDDGFKLRAVGNHEAGHNWGMNHHPDRRALLFPTYNPAIETPQPPDVEACVDLGYGRARPQPPAPPAPPTAPPVGRRTLTIEIDGDVRSVVIPGFTVTKNAG